MTTRIAVVGAGIVGASVARALLKGKEDTEVLIFDKEPDAGRHQTGHNSGVAHAGLYYTPGSLKATLCRRGMSMLKEFCQQRGVAYEERGKLVVARGQQELERMETILGKAQQNGVPGIQRLSREQIHELEPEVEADAALLSPHTAIVDFGQVARALVAEAQDLGARVYFDTEVTRLYNSGGNVIVEIGGEQIKVDRAVVCAGLQSDRLAASSGAPTYPAIVPFYGEYFLLNEADSQLVERAIYPVPDPQFPFLGVHITPRLDGRQMIGPNAFLSLARESYRRNAISPRDLRSMVVRQGFWRMGFKNLGEATRLLPDALSSRGLLSGAQDLVPRITGGGLQRLERGVRAQTVGRDGGFEDDFVVHREGEITFLRNAPSPGATSALALGEHLSAQMIEPVRK